MNHTYYLGEVLKGGTRALVSAGVENARYDAEELLGHVTGVSPRELLLHRDRELEASAQTRSTASPVLGLVPSVTVPSGAGIRSTMLSSSLAMPARFRAEQHTIGTTVPS